MKLLRSRLLFKPRSLFLILFGLAALYLSPSVCAQSQPSVHASEIAQEFFNQGLEAAEKKQWDLASRQFREAQLADPLNSVILHDLGRAYQMAGAPVLAALWLHAYLEAAPATEDLAGLRREITDLDAQIQQIVGDLLNLAQTAAQSIPEEIPAAREEALNALARVQALSGNGLENAGLMRFYGEYLAAARNYEEARTLAEKIQNASERQRLLAALARYQLQRNEEALALQTIRGMEPSEEKSVFFQRLAAQYVRDFEFARAEKLLEEVSGENERVAIQGMLLLGYLKAGDFGAAAHFAENHPNSKTARIVRGQGKDVVKEIAKSKVHFAENAQRQAEAYQAVAALAWMGELKRANEALPHAGPGDYGRLARATIAAEEKNWHEVSAQMRQMPAAVESDFALSLGRRLIERNHLEETGRLADAIRSSSAKAALWHLLAEAYRRQGNGAKAAEFSEKSFELALASNSSLTLREMGADAAEAGEAGLVESVFRVERLTHWLALARAFENQESILDLTNYLKKFEGGDYVAFTQAVLAAADAWASAALYIEGTKTWHEKD